MPKAVDAGREFLSSVLAKLPEEKRAQAEALFADAQDALVVMGTGALAQPEINRRLDDIRTQEAKLKEEQAVLQSDWEKLNNWYTPRKPLLDKYGSLEQVEAAINAARGTSTDPNLSRVTNQEPNAVGLTKEDLAKILEDRDRGYASVLAVTTTMASKHFADFGEVLDVNDLINQADKNRQSLEQAYQVKFGERLKEKAQKVEAERIQKLVDERWAEEQKKRQDQPFPLKGSNPSVLDVIESKGDPRNFTVDSAVAEYERLQAARN